jgi:hypothetical protein
MVPGRALSAARADASGKHARDLGIATGHAFAMLVLGPELQALASRF